MARRFDISDKPIHFTGGGECVDDAFARLRAIIREGRLIASNRMIRGGFGAIPDWAEERLAGRSPSELEDLSVRALDAQSIEDLLQ